MIKRCQIIFNSNPDIVQFKFYKKIALQIESQTINMYA